MIKFQRFLIFCFRQSQLLLYTERLLILVEKNTFFKTEIIFGLEELVFIFKKTGFCSRKNRFLFQKKLVFILEKTALCSDIKS